MHFFLRTTISHVLVVVLFSKRQFAPLDLWEIGFHLGGGIVCDHITIYKSDIFVLNKSFSISILVLVYVIKNITSKRCKRTFLRTNQNDNRSFRTYLVKPRAISGCHSEKYLISDIKTQFSLSYSTNVNFSEQSQLSVDRQ